MKAFNARLCIEVHYSRLIGQERASIQVDGNGEAYARFEAEGENQKACDPFHTNSCSVPYDQATQISRSHFHFHNFTFTLSLQSKLKKGKCHRHTPEFHSPTER